MEKNFSEKLQKAKAKILMGGMPFLSTIMLSLKHEESTEIPTAATNGLCVLYNPAFFENFTIKQLAWVISHELWHIALEHTSNSRRKDRNPQIWNMAGDYVINLIIHTSFERPPIEYLLNHKYHNWTTEQVYDDIKDNVEIRQVPMLGDVLEGEAGDEVDQKVKEILIKAATISKGSEEWGKLPGELTRAIDELIAPKIPWNAVLINFLNQMIKEDYSWKRRNRRHEEYLPSLFSEGLGDIVIAIDTSGSITVEDLTFMLSEIQYINDTYAPTSMKLIDCDFRINHIHEVERGDDLTLLPFSGNGGTSFHPVIEYCNEHPTNLLIYFTDLYAEQIKPEELGEYQVIWICYSEHEEAPTGVTIYYE